MAWVLMIVGGLLAVSAMFGLMSPQARKEAKVKPWLAVSMTIIGVVVALFGYGLKGALDHKEQSVVAEFVDPETDGFVCDDIRTEVSPEDLVKLEQVWGKTLRGHQEKLTANFQKHQPADYQSFAQFKASDWQTSYNKNMDKMNCGWQQFGRPMDETHQALKGIVLAMNDLNIISIHMQSYLRNGSIESLNVVDEKINEVSLISEKYSL